MDSIKFNCTMCGKCCRRIGSDTPGDNLINFPILEGNTITLSKKSLVIYDWETKHFPKEFVKPYLSHFDLKNETLIITKYTLNVNSCPNVKDDNSCGIYENRPILCKIYPCSFNGTNEDTYLDGKRSLYGVCSGELPNKELARLLGGRITKDGRFQFDDGLKFKKKLLERYGDSFIYYFEHTVILPAIMRILADLEKKGEIKLVKEGYDTSHLAKRIEKAKKIDISDFLRIHAKIELKDLFEKNKDKIREIITNS